MAQRSCARPGCGQPATATMTYAYGARTAWIDDLASKPDPQAYDLCAIHAERTGVPVGWACEDRRKVVHLAARLAG